MVGMLRISRSGRAFTLLELLSVIAVISILAALLFSAVQGAKARSRSVNCLSQLRQIGIASIAFADETKRHLFVPARVPTGTITNLLLEPFEAVIHEAGTAKIFLCPADTERLAAPNLTSLQQSNTSYFVSWSAVMEQPQSIVTGDRNITEVQPFAGIPGGVPSLMTGTRRLHRTNTFGWWRDMHRSKGNLLLADGSVHATKPYNLNLQIAAQPEPEFSWDIPNGNKIVTPSP
jgi:prepilin-type N-terminal cleavage/methylation domain-containing protein/prepilin-type processing-associated H-X9-DG protein